MKGVRTSSWVGRGALGVVLGLFCAAPTPGDVGGCGQVPQDLDPDRFFGTKQRVDCDRCEECSLPTDRCTEACESAAPPPQEFPEGCYPLVHDGEVCLRALQVASCDDYAEYMDDTAPAVPSECNFCPARGEGE